MAKNDQQLRGWLIAIVIVHGVVTLWHGLAHTNIPVPLTSLQTVFVSIVIILLPLIGAGLLWTSRKGLAALLITVSMLASLLFGLVNHFILDSTDYVMAVPEHEWRHSFVLSAVVVAVTETIGTVLGAIAMLKWRQVTEINREYSA